MTKKTVAARTMGDVKFRRGSEQLEVAGSELVQMRDDPALVDGSRLQEAGNRCFAAAIFHRTADAFQKIERRAGAVAKHLHFVLRFGEMRGQ